MKVVLISGKAGHGKDTLAGLLKQELEQNGNTVAVSHYADLLKFICKQFFGWNGEKDEAGRKLLQRIGTDTIRAQDPDFWVRTLAEILSLLKGFFDYVIIPDTRFPNEITYIKSRFDAVHIRVYRQEYESLLTEEQQNHPSETALDDCEPDIPVYNYTMEELEQTAKAIVWFGAI